MAETLRIFVSATNDLEEARSVIGTSVAELPVKIGVEIRRTPAAGAKYDDIFELIANCDRVYFLMGRDITAPAGAEWHLAWQLERSVMPLRASDHMTPAGREFLRLAPVHWTRFRNATELAQLVTLDLIRILDHPKNRYGLTVTELGRLARYAQTVQSKQVALPDEPTGAEGGGILLDNTRREPVDGISLGET